MVRRKIFKSGHSLVIALPKEMLVALRLSKTSTVFVELDPVNAQIMIRTVDVNKDFARQVGEFINHYRPALVALAKE